MKKTLLLGALSLAVSASSTLAQGLISLDNYDSTAHPLITYAAGTPANGSSGALGTVGAGIGSTGWTGGLYWTAGSGGINDPAGTGDPAAPLVLATGTGSTVAAADANTFGTAGQFASVPVWNSGSTANTTLTLEIIAYSGANYANAAYRGHSAPFSMPTGLITDTTPKYVGDYMSTFSVGPVGAVPEPTTFALAGLGAAALMFFRRKKA